MFLRSSDPQLILKLIATVISKLSNDHGPQKPKKPMQYAYHHHLFQFWPLMNFDIDSKKIF